MKKKVCTQKESGWSKDWPIELLEALLNENKKAGATNFSIECESDYDSCTANISFYYEREETESERIERQEFHKKWVEKNTPYIRAFMNKDFLYDLSETELDLLMHVERDDKPSVATKMTNEQNPD